MKRFMLTLVTLVVGLLLVANVASAHILFFDIDNTAVIHNPDQVTVTGTIQCTDEVFSIRLVLEQPHAYGTGSTREFCTGDLQRWTVQVTLESGTGFQPGPAEACANVLSQRRGTDAHEVTLRYCEIIELVPA